MNKTKQLTEIAVCVALSVICGFIKIWEMPQGGSVSLTMVPILYISYRRGVGAGMITGGIYGLLAVLVSGIIYHPLSVLLDYILAYGIIGISGLFGKGIRGIISGSLVGVTGRFICSWISGAVIFAQYAPVGQSPWLYSAVYQATYMLPELIISVFLLAIIYLKH